MDSELVRVKDHRVFPGFVQPQPLPTLRWRLAELSQATRLWLLAHRWSREEGEFNQQRHSGLNFDVDSTNHVTKPVSILDQIQKPFRDPNPTINFPHSLHIIHAYLCFYCFVSCSVRFCQSLLAQVNDWLVNPTRGHHHQVSCLHQHGSTARTTSILLPSRRSLAHSHHQRRSWRQETRHYESYFQSNSSEHRKARELRW